MTGHRDHSQDESLEDSTVHWMQWGVVLLVLMALAFPAYRIQEPHLRERALAHREVTLAVEGSALFEVTCATCHGPDGLGASAPALNSEQFLTSANDRQIEGLITLGVPGTGMPAFSIDFGGPLTLEQITALAVYLRSLEPTAPDNPNWQNPLASSPDDDAPATVAPTDDDEPATVAPTADGEELYASNCAVCHGVDLSGNVGPALGPGSDSSEESDTQLITTITNGSGNMPPFSDQLSVTEVEGIVAYLRQVQQVS
ncbi:MAG: c-type cytochrome [Acidimicrobiia bacterium]|nr:c-type cytochrome [Acidimicrobiia bacterium]